MAKAKSSTTKDKTKRPAAAKATKAAKTTVSAPAEETKVTRVSVVPERNTSALGKRLSEELVIGSLFAEMAGTFALTGVILVVLSLSGSGNPLMIALTIAGLYLSFARLSGAQLNPAITAAVLALGKMSWLRASGYVLAQIIGAIGAFVVVNQFISTYPAVSELTSQTPTMYKVTINAADTWRPFFAEMVGALIVGFAVAAVVLNRKNETEAGLAVGLAFLGGLTFALIGSAAILNPAVALGASAYHLDNLWTLFQYAGGPIVGVVVGAVLYKFLKWDLVGDKKAVEE